MAQGVRRVEGGSGAAAEGTGAGEREVEAFGLRAKPGEASVEGQLIVDALGCCVNPSVRRRVTGKPDVILEW
jgi:hypothetical protein